ncbi:MAG: TlpA family protein disulfide reductase [Terriglobia bacterium]
MRSRLLLSLAALLLLAALPCGRSRAQSGRAGLPPSGFVEGQLFPALVLPSAEDGRPLSLADFRGQKLLLHVFASW